ncbi:uncharacterized protein LOC129616474 [Condylostylus longicornis]|uniref:uncharacterized protein LOC129616474 n=1 Tax=Condylostylus longicornis TaxID=2530218 RepID=UPI00244E4E3E|nr:uncharacterized protein LOC129616474 [Condylostylus longicornis]XP_055388098.1 uncharacterized protein LOC129616474 [Condylostylus longicornis]
MNNNKIFNSSEFHVKNAECYSKQDETKEYKKDEAVVTIPPDAGWAWIVMISSFLCNIVVDGIVFSSGAIQMYIVNDFGASQGYVALVSSLLSGFYLIAGPFVSALCNRFGFRPVTIAGAIIASSAFCLSYFANSVEFLFLTYGIIGGIGFCLIYIPSVITIGYYFEKWRALATGIALCGSGVGTFIFAPLTKFLIQQSGWRNTLVIQGAIILSCAIYAMAYRPIPPIHFEISNKEEEINEKLSLNKGVSSKSHLIKPLPEGRLAFSVPNSAYSTYMGQASNSHHPTAFEVFRAAHLEKNFTNFSQKGTELKILKKSNVLQNTNDVQKPNFNLTKELATLGEREEEKEETESHNLLVTEKTVKEMQNLSGRRHTVSTSRRPGEFGSRNNKLGSHCDIRPMYRDDVFFTGSLVRIPQYTSQTSLAYHMSVTRLPTTKDLREREEPGCKIFPEAFMRTLSTMLDVELLKSPSFMLLCTSGFLTMMGFFIPFIFIERRAIKNGMDENTANFIISVIGITNTVSRIVCGMMSSFKISALHLNNVAITAGGVATCLSCYSITSGVQFSYAVMFGICIACFSALRSIIAVELMGLEKLTNAFGFLMLFQGLAAAIGSPIAGFFYDYTGSYNASFWFAGILITISAVLCYPLNYVNLWEKNRKNRKNEAQ